MPDEIQDKIRAKSIEIVDDQGRTRISMRTDGDETYFYIYDLEGGLKVSLEMEDEGNAGVTFYHKSVARAYLGVDKDGKERKGILRDPD